MSKNIYRFMDFSKFVDLVIHENLTLVSPTLWDDPFELEIFNKFMEQKKYSTGFDLEWILKSIIPNNLFAMSWTRLEESDALWRIYSDNNQSVRISVDEEMLANLPNCILRDVKYENINGEENLLNSDFYDLFSRKRKAFDHEKEVRLINHIKFPNDTIELKKYIKAILIVHFKKFELVPKNINLEEFLDSQIKLINGNHTEVIKKIPVTPINQFIKSVQLNPRAQDWQDDMMKTFCKKFNLNYLGKSALYTKTTTTL
ncbi:hypothetical protein RCG63_02720 [Lactococcus lactis]|uniref:DUF2971 domain-containing protein n=1 Tax=Lactococcus lactis TaxID=1358 RepID=A0ABD5GLS6_9LACT|nr:hypothetical protein [Lactococcus lactis]MDQ7158908.1 hypothetical protein [Lactococcus lactis]MDV2618168.1 hypothetical protein [Lactococcus lactis]